MTEASPQPTRSPEPDDIHWGVSYLRQDIQDLRQDLRQDIQEVRQDLRQDVQEVRQDLRQEVQEVRQDLRHQIGLVHSRIDETNK